jgi:hypothetical protein
LRSHDLSIKNVQGQSKIDSKLSVVQLMPNGGVMTDLRYPIGKPSLEGDLTSEQIVSFIDEVSRLPLNLRGAVQGLNADQLGTPYRPEGWMIRQVVHHLADSHMNAFVRFKLALTEDLPTIKPYNETLWAETVDACTAPIDLSLVLLDSLHERWTILMRSLKPEEFLRGMNHPERGRLTLEKTLRLYEWHGRHHTAQIKGLRQRMGW